MHLHWTLLTVLALAVGLSGCTRYYFFGSGEAACLELISEREPILKGGAEALKRWQATEYCRRVRERWAAIAMANLPDLGLPAPQQQFVIGNNVTFDVGVRNEGRTDSGPFDLLVEAWAGVTSSAPPTFSTTLQIGNLTPMGTSGESSHQQVTVTVPAERPVDVLLRLTADPPTPASPGGAVRESDENNNVRDRIFTIF
jgi:CARDB